MMSNVESMELLQAKALGCLDPEDDALFTKLMKEDENFPWQELGHYQNLVAFLPTLLDIEVPEPEVKDEVARKLSEHGEKDKAGSDEDVKQNTIAKEAEIEEDGFVIEEKPVEYVELPPGGEDLAKVVNIDNGISIKEHEAPLQNLLNDEIKMEQEPLKKQQQVKTETAPTKPKKEFEQKKVKSYVTKYPAGAADSESKVGLIVAVILFAIALLAVIFVYFNLSSDIQENRDKIDMLERQIGTKIILENTPTHKIFNT